MPPSSSTFSVLAIIGRKFLVGFFSDNFLGTLAPEVGREVGSVLYSESLAWCLLCQVDSRLYIRMVNVCGDETVDLERI